MSKLRVVALVHSDLIPPDTLEGLEPGQVPDWKSEYDVVTTLRERGHECLPVGVYDDLGPLRRAITSFKPHVVFNLLEEFHGVSLYDHSVVSYLELLKQRYTGCNPRGLMLAHDKALSKKILHFHRIPVPDFQVFPLGRKVRAPRKMRFPQIVKSLTAEASLGIARASIVRDEEQLRERVEFVHRRVGTEAISEDFIDGRELYVSVMGNQRLTTFPPWELLFTKAPEGTPFVATERVKWDGKVQARLGVDQQRAKDLPPSLEKRILDICKRSYELLSLTGLARIDLRLSEDGVPHVIEANPNPDLSRGEIFAESAAAAGLPYAELLEKLISLGMSYRAHWEQD